MSTEAFPPLSMGQHALEERAERAAREAIVALAPPVIWIDGGASFSTTSIDRRRRP
jgi:hypothetical protein